MRIARTIFPNHLERKYFREIKKLIDADRKSTFQAFKTEIIPRIHEYRKMLKPDTSVKITRNTRNFVVNDAIQRTAEILERLRNTSATLIFSSSTVRRIASEFVFDINRHQTANFKKQVGKVMAVDPTKNEPWLRSFTETAIEENVSYIKSIGEQYHDKINTVVIQGLRRGESINSMAEQISNIGDVSLNRGKFIARDQLGSIHGDLVKTRQSRIGLDTFIWRDSGDRRVRPSHQVLDGERFSWDEGARNERGEYIIPGSDFRCRCTAEIDTDKLEDLFD